MEDICVMMDGYKFNYRVAAIIKKMVKFYYIRVRKMVFTQYQEDV